MGGTRGLGTPFTSLEKADKFPNHVESIKHMDGHRFDRIKDEVKDGELIVTGEREVTQQTAGLSGEFTYCTLGAAVEMDKLLTGENLPAFDQLGVLLFHMATNQARPIAAESEAEAEQVAGCGYLGASSAQHVWLIYCPDLDFLKSRDAALTLACAKFIPARPSRTNRTWSMPPPGSSPSGSRRMPSSPSGWPLRPYLSPCTAWRSPNDHTARRHSAQPVTGRD